MNNPVCTTHEKGTDLFFLPLPERIFATFSSFSPTGFRLARRVPLPCLGKRK